MIVFMMLSQTIDDAQYGFPPMNDPSDKPTLSWRDIYDDRGQSRHASQAAVSAAARLYGWLYFDGRIYRVNKDGTYAATELTEEDVK